MEAVATDSPYPGALATPIDVLRLADEYRQAAKAIAGLGRRGDPVSMAPYRLMAIHAVELYLNALLLHVGHDQRRIRALHHNLAVRTDLSVTNGLLLRKKTEAHLRALAENREYLITRYGPELASTLSQINRLAATLEEVAGKVRAALAGGERCSSRRDPALPMQPSSMRAPDEQPDVPQNLAPSSGGSEARV
jgi:hypothetical protein